MTTSPPGSLALPSSLFCLFLHNLGSGERVGALRVLLGVGGDLKDDPIMINLLLDYFFSWQSVCASLSLVLLLHPQGGFEPPGWAGWGVGCAQSPFS